MVQRILAPVDLAHLDKLTRALDVAADLARHYGAPVTYVTVTSAAPNSLGHTPSEVQKSLDAFAAEQAATHGITATGKAIATHDPSIDVDKALIDAGREVDADLIVMATHAPNMVDYFWSGHGTKVAAHSGASVYLVRDA